MVFGKETYGLTRQDASSVAVVDAANSAFLQAKNLFILGFRAEEFPRTCPKGIFLPDELRNYLATSKEGESAYLYLRNSTNDYANECDFFEIVLRTKPEKVTILMPYHDERNHVLGWSPFVENSDLTKTTRPEYCQMSGYPHPKTMIGIKQQKTDPLG